MQDCERRLALAATLDDIATDGRVPERVDELLLLAEVAMTRKRYLLGAGLYRDALQRESELAAPVEPFVRYNATCAATLVSSGLTGDDQTVTPEDRTAWRGEALGWLRRELEDLAMGLDAGATTPIVAALEHWLADPDLDGVRAETRLRDLPPPESQVWRSLWNEHAKLLERARRSLEPGR
ncbi:MAG: hypothetical protein IPM29_00540 [Planctomycetes bacterium]|nr:hypothetical protein [Planctomycetota bacterium]